MDTRYRPKRGFAKRTNGRTPSMTLPRRATRKNVECPNARKITSRHALR